MNETIRNPILLLCSERSGSNLITKIFDAHPDYCGPGTAHLFRLAHEVTPSFQPCDEGLLGFLIDVFDAKIARWEIDKLSRNQLLNIIKGCGTSGNMCAALYNAEASFNQKKYCVVKENSAYTFMSMLMGVAHNPRLLFMVRDPRDMAVSWINGPVMRGGTIRAADRWLSDQTGSLCTISTCASSIPKAFLRYEDLLTDTENQLERVTSELNVPFSDCMLQHANKSASAKSDSVRSSMWSNLDKPLITDNVNKFHKHLSSDQVLYIESICAPYMQAFGYELINNAANLLRGAELEELRALLSIIEPIEKPQYSELSETERTRAENWNEVVAKARSRAPVSPQFSLVSS